VVLERRHERQIHAVQDIAKAGRHARVKGTPSYNPGCLALVKSMRYVTSLDKFRPEPPPRYDGSTNPVEFLQLYTLGIPASWPIGSPWPSRRRPVRGG
jgi:hypothetical protein